MIRLKISTIKFIVTAVIFGGIALAAIGTSLSTPLSAYSCNGSCSGGAGACIKKCNGKCCLWSSTGHFNCNVRLSGSEYYCNSGPSVGCTCNNGKCDEASGGVCTNVGQVCTCSCNPVGCPAGVPPSKFMTVPLVTSYGIRCTNGGCDGESYACDPVHRNAAPSCAMAPASITMTREDAARQIDLTTTDRDYGDTVQVTRVRVVDTAGNLKSCVNVKTQGGGSLENTTVKSGSDNSSQISQTTPIFIDPREAHGVFDNVGGQSICSGFIEVDIVDIDSDGGGPDSSAPASCKVAITVVNQAPTISDIKVIDQDVMTTVRDVGNNGNLLDGRGQVNVGSPLTTQSKSRASVCAEPLAILDPIKCPGGGERYEAGMSSRRNPLQIEFTIKDANGLDDILQAGLWIQRNAQDADDVALPPVNVGNRVRNSFQVMYSEKRDEQIVAGNNRWNLVSRACLTSPCGPTNLQASSNQIFSALAHIPALTAYTGQNGVIKHGDTQWASQKSWHSKGFPDCLFKNGCSNANVPDNAQTQATTAVNTLTNYEWAVAADQNHLICFPNNSLLPTVVTSSVPITCPVSCAACAKKEGVELVAGDPTALRFKFGVYFNDLDGGQGMPEGTYSIFVSALDKVAAPLYSVTGKGADGWLKFKKWCSLYWRNLRIRYWVFVAL